MICHWHGGLPGLTMDLPSLAISWITMVLWVYFFVFWLVLMFPLVWVELLVHGALAGKMLWSPITSWVELLVLESWLDKQSEALSGLS